MEETKTVNGEGINTAAENGAVSSAGTEKTFDEILNENKAHQAEFDRRVSKAIETAKTKWNSDVEKTISEKVAEAQKLAKMTADEKAEHERQERENDYKRRIADVTKRELKAEAKDTLLSEGLPVELCEVLNYSDAESCKTSIDFVKTAFLSAVTKAVNEKLKGTTPKGASPAPDYASMSDEEYYKNIYKK